MHLPETERERFQLLLMAAVDGELDAQTRPQFEHFVQHYPECRAEWLKYAKLKEVTQAMQFKNPPPEVWENYWRSVYNRLERGLGWILLSLGAVILLTYGGFKAIVALLADTEIELVMKIAILAVIAGAALLLVSVLREKLFTARTDKYQKEIER